MAYIKTLKDNELVGGTDHADVYPVTTTQAIFSQQPDGTVPEGIKHQRLEDRLQDGEADARELHRKAEKLVLYIKNNHAGETLEITGDNITVDLTGKIQLETFGDEPSLDVPFEKAAMKKLTISSGNSVLEEINDWGGHVTYILPNAVGQYKMRFDCTYNGVTKYVETYTHVNLRKYFGFGDETLSDRENVASHFSNGVSCTVTLPASGTGFKHIYFAVPSNMSISRVEQPDALNAPLAISELRTVKVPVGGAEYDYKVYQSNDLIDCSVSKRLTIK